jgi:hypothetical protein
MVGAALVVEELKSPVSKIAVASSAWIFIVTTASASVTAFLYTLIADSAKSTSGVNAKAHEWLALVSATA